MPVIDDGSSRCRRVGRGAYLAEGWQVDPRDVGPHPRRPVVLRRQSHRRTDPGVHRPHRDLRQRQCRPQGQSGGRKIAGRWLEDVERRPKSEWIACADFTWPTSYGLRRGIRKTDLMDPFQA
jgi:hypothetical protein